MTRPRLAALLWLGLALFAALLAPAMPLPDPLAVSPVESLVAPSGEHPLGADLLGRDMFSRIIWGARRTLGMAILAAGLTAVAGAVLGLASGYGGALLDAWLMRGLEVLLALPQLLVALVVVSMLGSSPVSVGLAVGLTGVAAFARVARAVVRQARGQQYVEAARALGLSPLQIAVRHLLPNIAGPLATLASIHFAWAILNTATLTFLGFGGDPSLPDWGAMLNDGRAYLLTAPWTSAAPGAAITLTVLAANTLGNSWGDA